MHRIYTWNFFFVGLGHEYSLTIRFYYTSAVLAQIETKTEAAEFSAFSLLYSNDAVVPLPLFSICLSCRPFSQV